MSIKLLKATKPNEYIHIAGYKTALKDGSVAYMLFAIDNFSYFGIDAKAYNESDFDTYLTFINNVLQCQELKNHFDKSGKTTLVIDLNNKFTRKVQKTVPKHVKIICDRKLARSITNKLAKAIFKD